MALRFDVISIAIPSGKVKRCTQASVFYPKPLNRALKSVFRMPSQRAKKAHNRLIWLKRSLICTAIRWSLRLHLLEDRSYPSLHRTLLSTFPRTNEPSNVKELPTSCFDTRSNSLPAEVSMGDSCFTLRNIVIRCRFHFSAFMNSFVMQSMTCAGVTSIFEMSSGRC